MKKIYNKQKRKKLEKDYLDKIIKVYSTCEFRTTRRKWLLYSVYTKNLGGITLSEFLDLIEFEVLRILNKIIIVEKYNLK